ncbi:MAG TPA: hypothetical protein ENL16_01940 [Candidatus Woesearchaeota archaeon]|nr:hypothetical protein [Candidatus Woesearchaeota archaeon]
MRRGQAALEFLTTYGWAFLVILIMIGALAYFGILSPGRFLPERCNIGPEFTCDEYQVTNSDGTLRIKFTNNVGETIDSVTVTKCWWAQEELNTSTGGITVVGGSGPYKAGDAVEINCAFDNTLFPPVGAKMKFGADITYIPQGKTYTKPLTAEVYTTLQP